MTKKNALLGFNDGWYIKREKLINMYSEKADGLNPIYPMTTNKYV